MQLQLLSTVEDAAKLEATMRRFNEAADWLAGEAFAMRSANKVRIQRTHYAPLRERFGLSAQMAVRCIAQVCEVYKRDKDIRPHFRPLAAVPYDRRIASWKSLDRISLLTLAGRILVPYIMGKYQRERFTAAKGQCDLVRRKDGKWFLLVTVDLPDKTRLPASDFIGVDFGVVSIATTSGGTTHSGAGTEVSRVRYLNARRSLQRAAAQKVAKGARPKSIRDRTPFRKPHRAKMSGWAFAELRAFVTYKAILAGVDLCIVDPRGTFQTCSACGFEAKANRKPQAVFACVSSGRAEHADVNAAKSIRARAPALVNAPIVSEVKHVA
ncbi:MAG: zinc ribbon domain-containing protein [Vulcanimicrobiaceae bacterium]